MTSNTIILATINFCGIGSTPGPRMPDFNDDFNADFLIGEEEPEDE